MKNVYATLSYWQKRQVDAFMERLTGDYTEGQQEQIRQQKSAEVQLRGKQEDKK